MARSISLLTTELAYVNKCDVTDTLLPHGAAEASFRLAQCNPLNDRSAEHDMMLVGYALINSRLEIPHTNCVVQCNTVPNSNTIANMYMYIRV